MSYPFYRGHTKKAVNSTLASTLQDEWMYMTAPTDLAPC